jgi:3-hydroxyisobutyrate dehydrogenase-like beta-hydroxyacid dehydrogenase
MGANTHLGFLGLGQMGAPMAERLLGPDVALHVYDPNPNAVSGLVKAGAIRHDSPRAVADAASIIMASLPNRQVSEEVALGPSGVVEGKAIRIYVEMSTVGRLTIEMISQGLASRDISTVDAPVSGGPPGARAGTLAIMVSGAPGSVAKVEPWLRRVGPKVYVLGDRPGQAQIMKLVNNLIMAANLVVASEGLTMGAKAGLDPQMMMDVLAASTGRSASSDMLARSALTGAFDFGAHLSIVEKDMTLGMAEARALCAPVPVIDQAGTFWHAAVDEGLSKEDFTAIIKMMERRAGVVIRSASNG